MINGKPTFSETSFDVIVIGAGINGAGIARDAAMRGLQVMLLDKADIGGGTSAWSTRLIHGGLRYLEYGELGLVRESLRERETLLRIAPHLVQSLPLLIPVYDTSRRGRWTIKAGMLAYDLLSVGKSLPSHRMLSRDQALARVAGLKSEGLVGAAVYYDGQVEFAERLVLENVLSAVEHGAVVQTYARVHRFLVDGRDLRGVEYINEQTGETSVARAGLVINAAGPWVDQVVNSRSGSSRLIGGTKGSHIVVGGFDGAPEIAVYVEAGTDRRPFFIIPWNAKYLIGTTDLRYDGSPDEVQISAAEIEYLLRETNRVIPSARLEPQHILYAYSGVRPLPFTADGSAGSITRRHFIRPHLEFENLLSIVGGKLTTYRSLAQEAVDLVFRKLGKESPRCLTAETMLPGSGPADSASLSAILGHGQLTELTLKHLLRTYGARASRVVALIKDDAKLGVVIDDETGAVAAEVVHAFRNEWAQTLTDCLMRRTMIGLNARCGLNAIEAVANVAKAVLGWADDRLASEVEGYRAYVSKHLLVANSQRFN